MFIIVFIIIILFFYLFIRLRAAAELSRIELIWRPVDLRWYTLGARWEHVWVGGGWVVGARWEHVGRRWEGRVSPVAAVIIIVVVVECSDDRGMRFVQTIQLLGCIFPNTSASCCIKTQTHQVLESPHPYKSSNTSSVRVFRCESVAMTGECDLCKQYSC